MVINMYAHFQNIKMKRFYIFLFILSVFSWSSYSVLADGYERLEGAVVHDLDYVNDSVVDTIQRRGLVKVGIGLFEPWVMCDTHGELIGYEIDVAKKLASDMGVRITFIRTDWYYIVPALIDERFDLVISGMAITPARGLLVNFTIPYSEFGTLVLINTNEIEEVQTITDLNVPEVIFGARAGTVPAQVAEDRFPQATLQYFDSDVEMLDALVAGEVHAVSADQIKATRWLRDHPEQLGSPFDLFNKVPEAVAIRKRDFDSLNFLNGWIHHYKSNGWLDERRSYWFDTREWEELVADDPDTVSRCVDSFANPYE